MPKTSTLVLRRLAAKQQKVRMPGPLHYADNTPDGAIIDHQPLSLRAQCPYALERFIQSHQGTCAVWEVVECFAGLERALPRAKEAKSDRAYRGQLLRIRDRRTNDIIMADIL